MSENKKFDQPKGDYKHFVRISNADLIGTKSVLYALRKIKGVNYMFANALLSVAGINKEKKAGVLTDAEISKIQEILKDPIKFKIPLWILNRRKDYDTGDDMHLITSDLDFTKDNDIKRLKKIKSFRGLRLAWGLPVRGQRTKSNFRRNKGKVTGVKRKK